MNRTTQVIVRRTPVQISALADALADEYGICASVKTGRAGTTVIRTHSLQSLLSLLRDLRRSGNDVIAAATGGVLELHVRANAGQQYLRLER